MNRRRILIFDSGRGGRLFIDPINQNIPNVDIKYISDPEYFPYGQHSHEIIENRVISIINKNTSLFNPDLIVIACNTASLIARKSLRSKFDIPIVCVEPAIKEACKLSQTGKIGLLATPLTAFHFDTDELIKQHAQGKIIIKYADNRLAQVAENKSEFSKELINDLKEKLSDVDTIIMGCTHYHFIQNELIKIFPNVIYYTDPIKGVLNQIKRLIDNVEAA